MSFGDVVIPSLRDLPLVSWPTAGLTTALSPRRPVIDRVHRDRLAVAIGDLPPIVIHLPTAAIIDGVHRWSAYRRSGRVRLSARAFSGSLADAILLGIRLNLVCGKSLSRGERRRAIQMLLDAFPDRSDRWIAEA